MISYLRSFNWQWHGSYKVAVLIAIGFILASYLGFWQLSRGYQKQAYEILLQKEKEAPPKKLNSISQLSLKANRFDKITIQGQYVPNASFLLMNQPHSSQMGFTILHVFKTTSNDYLLIDRGWVGAISPDTPQAYEKAPSSLQTLTGHLYHPSHGIQIGSWKINHQAPFLIQTVKYENISEELGVKIAPITLHLDTTTPSLEVIPIQFGLPAVRHFGYSLQWFSIGIALVIYYLLTTIRRYPLRDI